MSLVAMAFLMVPVFALAQKDVPQAETFTANAQVTSNNATLSAVVTIHLDRYTDPRDIMTMQDALKYGGYPRFLPALRQAPVVGSVEVAGRKVQVRWARQVANDKGRAISVITDSPIAFIGGAGITSKPRAGYELAIILIDVDASGNGSGTLAAAARIKPGGTAGVQLDDYAEAPIKLTMVRSSSH